MSISKHCLALLNRCVHEQQTRREPETRRSEAKGADHRPSPEKKLCSSFDLDLDPDEMGF